MTPWPAGTERIVLDTTDSTNEEARRRVAGDETGPLWIMARRQTAGRGRLARPWSTVEGNLAATFLFPHSGTPQQAALLSFAASLAVAHVLAALIPGAEIGLKWPNDALVNGRKASGILLESFSHLPNGRIPVAIGIGLNLTHHPTADQTSWPATSVAAEGATPPPPEAVLDLLAPALAGHVATLADQGFAPVRTGWLAQAAHLDREIEVRLPPDRTVNGRFADLDADGALVLEGPDGPRRIAAGDVFFPGGT